MLLPSRTGDRTPRRGLLRSSRRVAPTSTSACRKAARAGRLRLPADRRRRGGATGRAGVLPGRRPVRLRLRALRAAGAGPAGGAQRRAGLRRARPGPRHPEWRPGLLGGDGAIASAANACAATWCRASTTAWRRWPRPTAGWASRYVVCGWVQGLGGAGREEKGWARVQLAEQNVIGAHRGGETHPGRHRGRPHPAARAPRPANSWPRHAATPPASLAGPGTGRDRCRPALAPVPRTGAGDPRQGRFGQQRRSARRWPPDSARYGRMHEPRCPTVPFAGCKKQWTDKRA